MYGPYKIYILISGYILTTVVSSQVTICSLSRCLTAMSTDGNQTQSNSMGVSLDTVFNLLSAERRRRVLKLLDRYGTMRKSQLAEEIAKQEQNTESLDCQQRKRVLISLHQVHLPALENYGVIVETDYGYKLAGNADPLLDHL